MVASPKWLAACDDGNENLPPQSMRERMLLLSNGSKQGRNLPTIGLMMDALVKSVMKKVSTLANKKGPIIFGLRLYTINTTSK